MIQFCWQCPEHHSQVPAKNTPSLLVQALSGYLALVTSMSWSFFTACLIRCLLALTPTVSTSVLLSSIFMADSMVGEIWWWHSGKLVLLGALFGRYMGCLQGHRVLGTGRWVTRGSSACGYGLLLVGTFLLCFQHHLWLLLFLPSKPEALINKSPWFLSLIYI